MAKVVLVRHGQASFGKSNYDQLSELGVQQARWLGEHFLNLGTRVDKIVTGTMQRHIQTAQAFADVLGCELEHRQDANWNEFDFETLVKLFLTKHPDQMPTEKSAKQFFNILRNALNDWANGEILPGMPESWSEFQARIETGLSSITDQTDNSKALTMVFTSGGVIASALSQVLNAPTSTLIDLNLQTKNTSLNEVFYSGDKRFVASFNSVVHLEHSERIHAVTYA